MRFGHLLMPAMMLLASCSETPVEDKGDAAIAEHEIQIEEDAQSLEQAADQAVKAMEEDINADLAADGIADPVTEPPTEPAETKQ